MAEAVDVVGPVHNLPMAQIVENHKLFLSQRVGVGDFYRMILRRVEFLLLEGSRKQIMWEALDLISFTQSREAMTMLSADSTSFGQVIFAYKLLMQVGSSTEPSAIPSILRDYTGLIKELLLTLRRAEYEISALCLLMNISLRDMSSLVELLEKVGVLAVSHKEQDQKTFVMVSKGKNASLAEKYLAIIHP